MPMKIFIVNGQGGCGKTTFEKYISQYGHNNSMYSNNFIISIIDPIKKLAKQIGWEGWKTDKDRKFLHELKILIHNYNEFDRFYIIKEIEKAERIHQDFIFIDMREIDDIEWLKSIYPQAKSILILRGEFRKYGNAADDDLVNTIDKYDIIIENNGSLKDFESKALDFYYKEIEVK